MSDVRTKRFPFFSTILYTIAVLAAVYIFWLSLKIFFLAFAGVLLATLLYTIGAWVAKKTAIPYKVALLVVLLILATLLVAFFWVATPLISEQLAQLFAELPQSYQTFKELVARYTDGKLLKDENLLSDFIFKNGNLFYQATELFNLTASTIAGFIVFLLLGVYLAFNPFIYIKGFLHLFPQRKRENVEKTLVHLGKTLKWWLFGKLISMAVIGILTVVGLWILNVPLAFILGLLIALMTFIPYLGAILASIPAILVALAQSPTLAFYVIILYVIIHMIEGYGITPFVEQRTVFIPPALTVFVQVILSLLVGFLGLGLASPLTAVLVALFSHLHKRH